MGWPRMRGSARASVSPKVPQNRSEGMDTVTTACSVNVCVIVSMCAICACSHVSPGPKETGTSVICVPLCVTQTVSTVCARGAAPGSVQVH